MTEIAQLFESALRNNRASLLRKAAMNTVARMPAQTTLRDLMASDAAAAIRELTIAELKQALAELDLPSQASGAEDEDDGPPATREQQLYLQILEATSDDALTIGQIAKQIDVDVDELRGYLAWMKKMGKVTSSGRARATRYQAVR